MLDLDLGAFIVIGGLGVVVVGSGVLRAWLDVAPRLRRLRTMAPATTQSGAGPVRIEGTARGETPAASPVYGVPCFAWTVRVSEYVSEYVGRRRSWSWRLVHSESGSVPLEVEDEHGRALVRAGHETELDLHRDGDDDDGLPNALPECVIAYLRARGLVTKDASVQRRMLIEELRLEPGDPCTIFGELRREAAPASGGGHRESPTRPILVDGNDRLLVSDLPAAVLRRELRSGIVRTGMAFALGFVLGTALLLWLIHSRYSRSR